MGKDPHQLKEGDKVQWNWGGGAPSGPVTEVKSDTVEAETNRGDIVKKDGTEDDPAVKSDMGSSMGVGRANEMRGVEPREQRELYRSAVSEGGINIKQIVTK